MPVQLQWYPSLPILIVTYPDILSRKDYCAMCDQRQALLDEGPESVVVLADVRALREFPDAETLELCDTALAHPRVVGAVIVLDADFYPRLASAILSVGGAPHRVGIFKDFDAALSQAEARLLGAGS